ncbi:unnamed protein product [Rhodiola kirilowii]
MLFLMVQLEVCSKDLAKEKLKCRIKSTLPKELYFWYQSFGLSQDTIALLTQLAHHRFGILWKFF